MTGKMPRYATVIFCLSTVGCSVLAPRPDRSRFFTLTSMPAAHRAEVQPPQPGATRPIIYGLGPIRLPAYLDRNEVATRVSPTEVTYSTTDRWAAPLSATVSSVLLQDLSLLLGEDRVVPYPWVEGLVVDYQIEVGMLQFDSDVAGTTQLTAHWRVRNVRTGATLLDEETTRSRPGGPGDPNAAAVALSGTLSDLSEEIAAALRRLPAPQAVPAKRNR